MDAQLGRRAGDERARRALARGLRGLSDPARFRRWVYTVVTRLALRGRRAGAREHATASETLDAHAAPDDEAEARADERARVRRALDELAPEQRAVLSLRYLEGFELAELAEVLGVPEGTVKSRLHSARAGLLEFARRDRALRFLAWGTVGAMSLLAAWAAWRFLSAPADASVKRLVLDATLFLWGSLGVAFGKLWLFTAQAQLATQRELKRLELALLDARTVGA